MGAYGLQETARHHFHLGWVGRRCGLETATPGFQRGGVGGCCFCGNWKRITGLAGAWLAERFAAWLASWLDALLSGWVHACLLASVPACPPGSQPTLSACVCACLPACLSDCLRACLPACLLAFLTMMMIMMMMGGVGGVHEDDGDGDVFWTLF